MERIRANSRNPARGRDQPNSFQSVPALHVRPLDDADTPRPPMVSVCRRRAGALPDRARSGGPQGRASSAVGGVPAGDASRPKPRSSTARTVSAEGRYPNVKFDFLGYQFRPRRGQKLAERTNCSVASPPRSVPSALKVHAIDDPGLEHPATDPAVAGRHRPANSIRSSGGGSGTTGDTLPRRWNPCSDTSI